MATAKSSVAVAVLAVLAVLAGGWFMLVAPQRSEADDLRTEQVSAEASNATLRIKLETLRAQAKGLPAKRAELAALNARIPATTALPTLIRSLTESAGAAGITLVAISPGAPEVVSAPASTVTTPVAAPAATTGVPALQAIPVQLDVTGSYPGIERYVNRLEEHERSFLVTGFLLQNPDTDSGGRKLTLTLNGRVFVAAAPSLPTGAAVPTATVPAAAAPAAAAPAAAPAK